MPCGLCRACGIGCIRAALRPCGCILCLAALRRPWRPVATLAALRHPWRPVPCLTGGGVRLNWLLPCGIASQGGGVHCTPCLLVACAEFESACASLAALRRPWHIPNLQAIIKERRTPCGVPVRIRRRLPVPCGLGGGCLWHPWRRPVHPWRRHRRRRLPVHPWSIYAPPPQPPRQRPRRSEARGAFRFKGFFFKTKMLLKVLI